MQLTNTDQNGKVRLQSRGFYWHDKTGVADS